MKQKLIQTVVTDMLSYLNNAQVEKVERGFTAHSVGL